MRSVLSVRLVVFSVVLVVLVSVFVVFFPVVLLLLSVLRVEWECECERARVAGKLHLGHLVADEQGKGRSNRV